MQDGREQEEIHNMGEQEENIHNMAEQTCRRRAFTTWENRHAGGERSQHGRTDMQEESVHNMGTDIMQGERGSYREPDFKRVEHFNLITSYYTS